MHVLLSAVMRVMPNYFKESGMLKHTLFQFHQYFKHHEAMTVAKAQAAEAIMAGQVSEEEEAEMEKEMKDNNTDSAYILCLDTLMDMMRIFGADFNELEEDSPTAELLRKVFAQMITLETLPIVASSEFSHLMNSIVILASERNRYLFGADKQNCPAVFTLLTAIVSPDSYLNQSRQNSASQFQELATVTTQKAAKRLIRTLSKENDQHMQQIILALHPLDISIWSEIAQEPEEEEEEEEAAPAAAADPQAVQQ